MKSLDELSINEAITLYYEKHHAIRIGNLEKLRELKIFCPDLFDKKKEQSVIDVIDDAKRFAQSPRYKELRRLELKEKLSVVKNDLDLKDD